MRRNLIVLFVGAGLVAAGFAVRMAQRQDAARPPAVAGPRLLWTFEAPQPGFVVGAPIVSEEAIYLAVGHSRGFQQSGAVYALDPAAGKLRWVYTASDAMLQTASTPLLARGRLIVGEGLHNNFSCRMHCIDARTGVAAWTFPTQDHIEGGPALAGDLVVFPAGNDGVYAVDLESGKEKWNFRADLHIDSTPFVHDGRVFVGSGQSRRFQSLQAVCLDAATGKSIWRTPLKLPAWGSPVVAAGRVFMGLGNGRLTQADPAPAGGLACLDAVTGKELWTVSLPDAVFGRPAIAGNRVVFGSRDGCLRGLSFAGEELFRIDQGGPVMAPPAVAGEIVYAVSVLGRVISMNAEEGRERWRWELRERGSEPRMFAGPTVVGNRLFVAGEMMAGQLGVVCLHCFELPEIVGP